MTSARPILGLSCAHLVTDLYTPIIPAILPLLIIQYGYPYLLAGLFITVFQVTSSLAQPFIGWLYDVRGRAVHVSASIILCATCIPAIGLMTDYYAILLCAALGGLGHALFHPSAFGTVSRIAPDHSRGRLTAYFVVGGNFGYAIGPVIAAVMVGLFGLKGISLLFFPGILTAVALWRILPDPAATILQQQGDARGAAAGESHRGVALVVAGSACRAWAISASIAFLPTLLITRGMELVGANMLVSGMLLAGVAGQITGGIISDRIGRKEYTLAGLLASVPMFLLFITTTGTVAVIALILFGFFLWSTFSVTVAMAHELMPSRAGLVSGLVLGLAVGTGGAGVAVTGLLADSYGLGEGFALLLLPILAALAVFASVPYPLRLLESAAGRLVKKERSR
ncbi:MAG: MFS transporter [Methanomicrobiales archaeon]|nr:MFS transporter [Methanomicrobiales archaeon]